MVELYASHNSNPIEKSFAINNSIREIVESKLQSVFPNYDYFIGHFMVKGANTEKEFSLHQDWNIVDESKYKSYQIWIPLQLSYPTNGGIFVVPGSHRFFNNYRSGSYNIPMMSMDDQLKKVCTDVIVPSGNILVYHNSLFHGSYPNNTNEDRVVVLANIVQRHAPTYYFHKNPAMNRTELYLLSGTDLIRHLPQLEKGIIEGGLTIKKTEPIMPIDNSAITSAEVVAKYHEHYGDKSARQLKQLHITTHPQLEEELNHTGYAIIDLLNEEEVETFKTEYKLHFGHIDRTPGRFTTLQDAGKDYKKKIHAFIVKQLEVPLGKYFKDYIIPVSQFYTKKAFTSGDIDLHADSTLLLNHQLEPHYAVWVPLIEVNKDNGTLTVVPFSHRVTQALFASSLGGYHHEHMDWLRQFEIPLHLKPGQAVIFDNNLLHNSTANKSSFDRLVFTFRITHYASQYYSFFCKNPKQNTAVEVSEESHCYYMDDNWDGNATQVTGTHIGTYLNGITRVTKQELQSLLSRQTEDIHNTVL